MEKLILVPDSEGYTDTEGDENVSVALTGGPSRIRKDKFGAPLKVSVRWTLDRDAYAYWRAFYVTATKRGALRFLCPLLSEDGTAPVDHVCQFVPGTVGKPLQKGLTYVQQAQLEAEPLPHNQTVDDAVIALYPVLAGSSAAFLNALEMLMVDTAPNEIPA